MTDGFINNENNELLQSCLVSNFPCERKIITKKYHLNIFIVSNDIRAQ